MKATHLSFIAATAVLGACSGGKGSASTSESGEAKEPPVVIVEHPGLAPTAIAAAGGFLAWQPIEFTFDGPASDQGAPAPNNPFLDYRLQVAFVSADGTSLTVPGFFDGDGQGGGTGNKWRVRFTPPKAGRWGGIVSFKYGSELAVSLDPQAGTPVAFDGLVGRFFVKPPDPAAPGFYKDGPLEYVGEHYLRHASGRWFLKAGADSPENFLGYKGFDGAQDFGGIVSGFLHDYNDSYLGGPTHLADYQGDGPLFYSKTTGYSSEAICGALNYLSSQHVNCLYFLPMNLGGDGQDAWPFVGASGSHFDNTHYDLGRMRQWNQVFEHAMSKGILLQFVLMETETQNENWLDGNAFGVETKLFYREMVARFGHLPAIKWNLGEENDSLSVAELEARAQYIQDLDPFYRSLAVHTRTDNFDDYDDSDGDGVVGHASFTSTSIQYTPDKASQFVEEWRSKSAAAGQKWVVEMDENSGGLTPSNHVDLRKRVLYDVLFSGGGIEWYCGYQSDPSVGGDVNMENFRSREDMWRWTWYARKFMEEDLPFWEMAPMDALVTGESTSYGGAEVFAKPGEVYAIYLPSASPSGTIDLAGAPGSFAQRWYNPRTGSFEGTPKTVAGGGPLPLGTAPSAATEDWVVLVQK